MGGCRCDAPHLETLPTGWLFARHSAGTFILRIEDTDIERTREEWVDGIQATLRWLGLDWDDGPFRQSQRAQLYADAAERAPEFFNFYRSLQTYRQALSESQPTLLLSADARFLDLLTAGPKLPGAGQASMSLTPVLAGGTQSQP